MDISNFLKFDRYKWSLFGMKICNHGKFVNRNDAMLLIERADFEVKRKQSEIYGLQTENERLLKIANDKVLELLKHYERDRLVLKLYGEDYDKMTRAVIWIYQSDKTEVEITKKL